MKKQLVFTTLNSNNWKITKFVHLVTDYRLKFPSIDYVSPYKRIGISLIVSKGFHLRLSETWKKFN